MAQRTLEFLVEVKVSSYDTIEVAWLGRWATHCHKGCIASLQQDAKTLEALVYGNGWWGVGTEGHLLSQLADDGDSLGIPTTQALDDQRDEDYALGATWFVVDAALFLCAYAKGSARCFGCLTDVALA